MKYFSIPEPCSENWNEMTATEKGAFCQKCSNEVHDVSQMCNDEIVTLLATENKIPCMRMKSSQEKSLNLHLGMHFRSEKRNMQRAMLFSLLVVFGFTLFSCNNSQQIHERNLLVSVAESIANSLERATTDVELPVIELTKTENVDTPEIVEKVSPPECVIDEPELLLLGEPVVYEERTLDEAKVVRHQKRVTDSYITGAPRMIREVEPVVISEFLMKEEASSHDPNIPQKFSTLAFPNPATTSTRLEVALPKDTEKLGIRLLDLNGRVLQNISEKPASAGNHEFQIDLIDLKPAYYIIDVRYDDQRGVVRLNKVQ